MAAGGTSSNVHLGPGRIYVASVGTAEPANASTALPSAWTPVGYTEEGSAFQTEVTREPVEVAEELDPIKYVATRRTNQLVFSMAETSRKRLVLALGGGVVTTEDGTFFEPPDPGTDVAVMIVWDSNEDPTVVDGDGIGNRRWVFRQVRPSGQIEIARRKAPAKALLPVTFNIEKPSGLRPYKVFPASNGAI